MELLGRICGGRRLAVAETVTLKAELKGTNQVPPNDSKGTGTADVSYDTTSKNLTWTITYSGLTGDATAAHFHGPADTDKTAGIAVPITGDLKSPVKGSATLTDAQAADLLAGRYYLNIHTALPQHSHRGPSPRRGPRASHRSEVSATHPKTRRRRAPADGHDFWMAQYGRRGASGENQTEESASNGGNRPRPPIRRVPFV